MDEIKNFILRLSLDFQAQKKSILRRMTAEMTGFTLEQLRELDGILNGQSNLSLRMLAQSRKSRREFINLHLQDTSNVLPADIDIICRDLQIENPTPQQIKIFQKWSVMGYISEADVLKIFQ